MSWVLIRTIMKKFLTILSMVWILFSLRAMGLAFFNGLGALAEHKTGFLTDTVSINFSVFVVSYLIVSPFFFAFLVHLLRGFGVLRLSSKWFVLWVLGLILFFVSFFLMYLAYLLFVGRGGDGLSFACLPIDVPCEYYLRFVMASFFVGGLSSVCFVVTLVCGVFKWVNANLSFKSVFSAFILFVFVVFSFVVFFLVLMTMPCINAITVSDSFVEGLGVVLFVCCQCNFKGWFVVFLFIRVSVAVAWSLGLIQRWYSVVVNSSVICFIHSNFPLLSYCCKVFFGWVYKFISKYPRLSKVLFVVFVGVAGSDSSGSDLGSASSSCEEGVEGSVGGSENGGACASNGVLLKNDAVDSSSIEENKVGGSSAQVEGLVDNGGAGSSSSFCLDCGKSDCVCASCVPEDHMFNPFSVSKGVGDSSSSFCLDCGKSDCVCASCVPEDHMFNPFSVGKGVPDSSFSKGEGLVDSFSSKRVARDAGGCRYPVNVESSGANDFAVKKQKLGGVSLGKELTSQETVKHWLASQHAQPMGLKKGYNESVMSGSRSSKVRFAEQLFEVRREKDTLSFGLNFDALRGVSGKPAVPVSVQGGSMMSDEAVFSHGSSVMTTASRFDQASGVVSRALSVPDMHFTLSRASTLPTASVTLPMVSELPVTSVTMPSVSSSPAVSAVLSSVSSSLPANSLSSAVPAGLPEIVPVVMPSPSGPTILHIPSSAVESVFGSWSRFFEVQQRYMGSLMDLDPSSLPCVPLPVSGPSSESVLAVASGGSSSVVANSSLSQAFTPSTVSTSLSGVSTLSTGSVTLPKVSTLPITSADMPSVSSLSTASASLSGASTLPTVSVTSSVLSSFPVTSVTSPSVSPPPEDTSIFAQSISVVVAGPSGRPMFVNSSVGAAVCLFGDWLHFLWNQNEFMASLLDLNPSFGPGVLPPAVGSSSLAVSAGLPRSLTMIVPGPFGGAVNIDSPTDVVMYHYGDLTQFLTSQNEFLTTVLGLTSFPPPEEVLELPSSPSSGSVPMSAPGSSSSVAASSSLLRTSTLPTVSVTLPMTNPLSATSATPSGASNLPTVSVTSSMFSSLPVTSAATSGASALPAVSAAAIQPVPIVVPGLSGQPVLAYTTVGAVLSNYGSLLQFLMSQNGYMATLLGLDPSFKSGLLLPPSDSPSGSVPVTVPAGSFSGVSVGLPQTVSLIVPGSLGWPKNIELPMDSVLSSFGDLTHFLLSQNTYTTQLLGLGRSSSSQVSGSSLGGVSTVASGSSSSVVASSSLSQAFTPSTVSTSLSGASTLLTGSVTLPKVSTLPIVSSSLSGASNLPTVSVTSSMFSSLPVTSAATSGASALPAVSTNSPEDSEDSTYIRTTTLLASLPADALPAPELSELPIVSTCFPGIANLLTVYTKLLYFPTLNSIGSQPGVKTPAMLAGNMPEIVKVLMPGYTNKPQLWSYYTHYVVSACGSWSQFFFIQKQYMSLCKGFSTVTFPLTSIPGTLTGPSYQEMLALVKVTSVLGESLSDDDSSLDMELVENLGGASALPVVSTGSPEVVPVSSSAGSSLPVASDPSPIVLALFYNALDELPSLPELVSCFNKLVQSPMLSSVESHPGVKTRSMQAGVVPETVKVLVPGGYSNRPAFVSYQTHYVLSAFGSWSRYLTLQKHYLWMCWGVTKLNPPLTTIPKGVLGPSINDLMAAVAKPSRLDILSVTMSSHITPEDIEAQAKSLLAVSLGTTSSSSESAPATVSAASAECLLSVVPGPSTALDPVVNNSSGQVVPRDKPSFTESAGVSKRRRH